MVQKIAKDELEQLNSLHRSYLGQLSQQFHQQFPNTVDQGHQYWEEFLEFVRMQILPSSELRDFTAYKPPFEVVSRFKEWKIAELEKKIAHIESAYITLQTVTTTPAKNVSPTKHTPQNGDVGNMKTNSDQDEAYSEKLEPHIAIRKGESGPHDSRTLRDLKINKSVLQVAMSYSLEDWYRDAFALARIAKWGKLIDFQHQLHEVLVRQTGREFPISATRHEIRNLLKHTNKTPPGDTWIGLSHHVVHHILPRFSHPWPFRVLKHITSIVANCYGFRI
ncbi:hypothetical protein F4805DRAFT_194753 [Annulohypoxylon moriforme]|nr:hypothetical protein F4805DRAFT_194753 [Annulohypoxylon moriforme]